MQLLPRILDGRRVWWLFAGALLFALVVALITTAGISAQTAATTATGYELSWFTMDGGGGTSTGTGYILSGTIGQMDAGTQSATGYSHAGGFWPAIRTIFEQFLPLIRR